MLADGDARVRMGAAGREAAKRYAWPRIAEQTLAVYERVSDLVAERPGRSR
jgi:glycosyltransferase involved in cell wall biosynthesis